MSRVRAPSSTPSSPAPPWRTQGPTERRVHAAHPGGTGCMTFPPPRRAKIVCTLGPATRTAESVAALIDAGMDVARLNLSHGSHDEHRALSEHVRREPDPAKRPGAVGADRQGPK